jgi:hypothetical protein
MYANLALKADYPLPRFLTDQAAVYRSAPRTVVRQRIMAEEPEQSVTLLAKEEWCCDRATD